MFPVHTWLPDAHTEAPTAGSVILAGILLKMGGYGLLRIALPILPDAVRLFLTPMLVLSGVAIVYGAYVTLAQTDIKRLIAYSSISHMGFVTLGIFSLDRSGIEGAILQMINHGIITGALFLCVGMIYERTHTREVAEYGGLFKIAPIYSTFLAIFCLAAAGTPGLNSFVGEFLIILGAIRVWPWIGAMAVWGVALGAAYVLWLFYRMAIGELGPAVQRAAISTSTSVKSRRSRRWSCWPWSSASTRNPCSASFVGRSPSCWQKWPRTAELRGDRERSARPASGAGACRRGPDPHRRRIVESRAQVLPRSGGRGGGRGRGCWPGLLHGRPERGIWRHGRRPTATPCSSRCSLRRTWRWWRSSR